MSIENIGPLKDTTKPLDTVREDATNHKKEETTFEPEIIGIGDMLIKVEDVNDENIYAITVSLGDGQYEMKVTDDQLKKLKDGTYTVMITPSGSPMLQKLG